MTRSERAAQLWPLLAWSATNRQTLTYGIVSQLTGLPQQSLGKNLEPIQSYCLERKIPPLTALVVSITDGRPGPGNIESGDPLQAYIRIFEFNWLEHGAPSPDELAQAVQRTPSNATNVGQQCDAHEAGLACVFEVDDRSFRLGDHGRYHAQE